MLPQLFVNYKVRAMYFQAGQARVPRRQTDLSPFPVQMKSVAHLPWKAFTYKVSAARLPSPLCDRVSLRGPHWP